MGIIGKTVKEFFKKLKKKALDQEAENKT